MGDSVHEVLLICTGRMIVDYINEFLNVRSRFSRLREQKKRHYFDAEPLDDQRGGRIIIENATGSLKELLNIEDSLNYERGKFKRRNANFCSRLSSSSCQKIRQQPVPDLKAPESSHKYKIGIWFFMENYFLSFAISIQCRTNDIFEYFM